MIAALEEKECKSRSELIFVEGPNVIVSSTLVKALKIWSGSRTGHVCELNPRKRRSLWLCAQSV